MNQLYDTAARALALGQLIWPDTELVLVVWGGTPVFDATHTSVAAIRAAAGVTELGASLPILERTVAADGTCQTSQVVVENIPIGSPVTWFTLCKAAAGVGLYSGAIDTAVPILFVDEASYLPFHPEGVDMIIQPDWAFNRGWFRP